MSLKNLIRSFRLPKKEELNSALYALTKKERLVFASLALIFFVSAMGILQTLNKSFMVEMPLVGGSISEGIVGSPRFVNPVLASSQADLDLVALVYSGLLRKNEQGELAPDLAEKYEQSADGLSYTFTLKDKIYFHNKKPVTTEDVIFTIDKIKNSIIQSPHKAKWDGVMVEKLDEKTLKFTLKQPNPDFLQNATLGIMPKALWENSGGIELNPANTNPVGSGPYRVKNIGKGSGGIINYYQLSAFDKFVLGKPYIKDLNLRFYPNEAELVQALQKGEVEQISSITPKVAEELKEKNYKVSSAVLPRVFGLFFNQNQNQLFLDKTVVKAINDAIDKERIVREVLYGYGIALDGPLPPSLSLGQTEGKVASREERRKSAAESLGKDGWQTGPNGYLEKTTTGKNKKKTTETLQFSIATGNAPELVQTAELIAEDLAALGMKVEIKTFEVGDLNQNVIRPRKYDALLFGEVVGSASDLFAFWHSSQRKDPGFNVAMYTSAKADQLLESAAVTLDEEARLKKYAELQNEIKKDRPAAFIYSPDFIYVVSPRLQGLTLESLSAPADRFANIYSWFVKTQGVWKIFN